MGDQLWEDLETNDEPELELEEEEEEEDDSSSLDSAGGLEHSVETSKPSKQIDRRGRCMTKKDETARTRVHVLTKMQLLWQTKAMESDYWHRYNWLIKEIYCNFSLNPA